MSENKTVESEDSTQKNNDGEESDFDSILESLSKNDSSSADEEEDEKEDKTVESKDYFKKMGTFTFKTEAEYDKWALKNYGEVSRLTGELKKSNKKSETPVEKEPEQKSMSPEMMRWAMKWEDIKEEHPEAIEYKEEIFLFLKKGKALDEKGRPSFKVALDKALMADGKDGINSSKSEINNNNENKNKDDSYGEEAYYKRRENSDPYQTKRDLDSINDFAKNALFRI